MSESNLRILQRSPVELIAYDPPYVVFGALAIFFSLVMVGIMLFVAKKTGWSNLYLIGFGVAALFSLAGIGTMTSVSHFRFSRQSGELVITNRIFGINTDDRHFPLADLDHAEIETSKNLRRIVLVRRSGPLLFLTSATDREGYYEFKDAINRFLAGH